MWGGPLDPSGSYNLMDQYSDGTPVLRNDFNQDNYPNIKIHTDNRLKFGDLDYFNHASPSESCTSIRLRETSDNHNVYGKVTNYNLEDHKRSVVCLGKKDNKKILH